MVDVLTVAQRKKCMARVKNKNTFPEVKLRKALWAIGLRYRLNYKLYGKPDLVFVSAKVAVFIDGCFWHGCPIHGQAPKTNEEFWSLKIQKNKARDADVNAHLTHLGWTVYRVWEHDVRRALADCVQSIVPLVKKEKTNDT